MHNSLLCEKILRTEVTIASLTFLPDFHNRVKRASNRTEYTAKV